VAEEYEEILIVGLHKAFTNYSMFSSSKASPNAQLLLLSTCICFVHYVLILGEGFTPFDVVMVRNKTYFYYNMD
jgi:hypothetical protein